MGFELDSDRSFADGVAAGQYWHFLVGYLALTVVGGVAIVYLVKKSTILMAGIEIIVALTVLTIASLAVLPMLYKDATALARANASWQPDWWKYVAFVAAATVVAFLVGSFIAGSKIATFVAAFALIVATVEACVVYLYFRSHHVGLDQ